jgi:sarcosine oxidase
VPQERTTDAIVIGTGVFGLSAAWQLQRLGCRRLTVVERFALGHRRGSSHGTSRIARSFYHNPVYVELMQEAAATEWPRLERTAGERLLHPRPGCFFGPPCPAFDAFRETLQNTKVDADLLSPTEAARRFPQFRFEGMAGAIEDRTAAVVAARRALLALEFALRAGGARFLEETTVTALEAGGSPIRVDTDRGTILAERVVVAAGPWTGRLLPFLAPHLSVARQHVGYFALPGSEEDMDIDRFPLWAYVGEEPHDFYYGLPAFGRPGVKLARHRTSLEGDDPDPDPGPDPAALTELASFLEAHFTAHPARPLAAETCLYTNTPTEDFVLDLHPRNPRVAIGAGFSGHGFKFGPLGGRILAELAWSGETGVETFRRHRDVFAIPAPLRETA